MQVLKHLREETLTVTRLAEELDKSRSWISQVVSDLEENNLVRKNAGVKIADTYEASLLTDLAERYDLKKILSGKTEDVLKVLARKPQIVADLEKQGFATSTLYRALEDLKEAGAVEKTEKGYRITDESLKTFLEARIGSVGETVYRAGDESVVRISGEEAKGESTAFSAFTRYGVEYHPKDRYLHRGDEGPSLEDVLIHSLLFAEDRKQMSMCGIFYLRHRTGLDREELWKLASRWGTVERLADLLAYIDRRNVKQEDLFLPWDEFTQLSRDYEVHLPGKHPEDSLLKGFERVGKSLQMRVDTYLLGGANLILRGLKDTTKDVDLALRDREDYRSLVEILKDQGFGEKPELGRAYEGLRPSIVLEREGSPRWDLFLEEVAGTLQLTEEMVRRSEKAKVFGNLTLRLLSFTDLFIFKSVTDREGDLEDAALIARQGEIDWNQVLEEVKRQEELSGRYLSFTVLDTLDILKERHGIETPVHRKLESHCLETALLLTLTEPKTIKDLRQELDFPDHRIYNKLRKLEREGVVEVDRSGELNRYSQS